MERMGLDVPRKDVDALFDSWDPDGSGTLDFKELQKVLRGGSAPKQQLQDNLKKAAAVNKAAKALGDAGKDGKAKKEGKAPPSKDAAGKLAEAAKDAKKKATA